MAVSKVVLIGVLCFLLSACDGGASVSLVPKPDAGSDSIEAESPQGNESEADSSQTEQADPPEVNPPVETDSSQNDEADAEPSTDSEQNTSGDTEPVAQAPANDDIAPEEPEEAELPADNDVESEPAEDSPIDQEADPEPVADSPANDESDPAQAVDSPSSDETDPEPVADAPADGEPAPETPTESPPIENTDPEPIVDTTPVVDNTPAQIEVLNVIFEDELRYQNVLGGAVAVVQNGAIVHANGYGFTSPDRDDPVSTDTVFRWASISKTLTAISALQLDEASENFSIEDTVSRHVDYWTTDTSSNKSNVTVKQLLSHRSGVTHYRNASNCPDNPNPDYNNTLHGDVPFNARNAVNVFSDQSLCFNPGSQFRYSTFAFSLAAAALEKEAGKTYTDWVQEQIAVPLGLQSLTQGTGISAGYRGDCGELTRASEASKSYVLPGGGWASNIVDLAKFANGILQGSLLDRTDRLWNEPTGNNTYALGINSSVDGQRVSHSGGHGDLRTYMELYLNDNNKTGIVVYLNHPHSDPIRIVRRVADELGIANWSVPLDGGCQ